MAKLIETKLIVKFSTIVADKDAGKVGVLTPEQVEMLSKSIPELAESIIDSSAIVVEVELD